MLSTRNVLITKDKIEEKKYLYLLTHPSPLVYYTCIPRDFLSSNLGGDTIEYVVQGDRKTKATLRFATDSYPGRCIFHCHILIHEDMGMMGFYNFTGPDGIIWEGAKIVNPLCRLPTSALLPYTDPTPNPTSAPVRPPSSPPPSPSPTRKSSKKKSKSSKKKSKSSKKK